MSEHSAEFYRGAKWALGGISDLCPIQYGRICKLLAKAEAAEPERDKDPVNILDQLERAEKERKAAVNELKEVIAVNSILLAHIPEFSCSRLRIKALGAKEWLEAFAKKDAFEKLAFIQDATVQKEIARLRREAEEHVGTQGDITTWHKSALLMEYQRLHAELAAIEDRFTALNECLKKWELNESHEASA